MFDYDSLDDPTRTCATPPVQADEGERIGASLASVAPKQPAEVHSSETERAETEPATPVPDACKPAAVKLADADDIMPATDPPAETAAVLDESTWEIAAAREPRPEMLRRWASSAAVSEILGEFVVEDKIGCCEAIKFRDVYRLMDAMRFSRYMLVAKFVDDFYGPSVRELADQILRRFSSDSAGAKSMIRPRNLYRLLEVAGFTVRTFVLRFKPDYDEFDDLQQACGAKLGSYQIHREIGSGFNGVCCYMASHLVDGSKVAVKWPVQREELNILRDISKQAPPDLPGMPRVLASGTFENSLYVVTELLGSPLAKVFKRLEGQELTARWSAISILGRLILRRLEAVHRCGYVHCDISPENILLGRAGCGGVAQVMPHLIDFGLARKFPGGLPLAGDHGSAEWSSIRSADGGTRLPQDDLEALGWTMLNGLFGNLPWFPWLSEAYEDWEAQSVREAVIKRVQEAKTSLLERGWDSLGKEWHGFAEVPAGLDRFIRWCRNTTKERKTGRPDYQCLAVLLGGPKHLAGPAAEREDLRQYQELVAPLT